jgi:hypothetical protein
MPEDKKGHLKVTIEVEVNEPLMDALKDSINNMTSALPELVKTRKDKEEK